MTKISDEELTALFFKLMANRNRLKIMNTVKDKPKTVNEISKDTGFEQSWVSHSLRLLKDNGIVESKREGKYVYYKLDGGIKPVIEVVKKVAPKYSGSGDKLV